MSKPLSKYGKGMIIKRHKFQNKMGDEFSVLKLAINVAEFKENPVNEKGFSNFEIKFRAGDDSPYIVIDNFANSYYDCLKTKENTEAAAETKQVEETAETEEIPF